ncbi:MAG: hypothetical protein CM15mP25_4360 [Gammaproteobacteria bacterium]|nr:MAG: hypothetical protein CM15mP25_4360 [Gammaproteobacteria bacterium]
MQRDIFFGTHYSGPIPHVGPNRSQALGKGGVGLGEERGWGIPCSRAPSSQSDRHVFATMDELQTSPPASSPVRVFMTPRVRRKGGFNAPHPHRRRQRYCLVGPEESAAVPGHHVWGSPMACRCRPEPFTTLSPAR